MVNPKKKRKKSSKRKPAKRKPAKRKKAKRAPAKRKGTRKRKRSNPPKANPKKRGRKKSAKRKSGKRKLTPYNRHMSREMKAGRTFKQAVSSWKKNPAKKANPKKRRKTRRKTKRKKSRGNWGTKKGAGKGWTKREKRTSGYKKTRGAKYPRATPRRKTRRKSNPRKSRAQVDRRIDRHVKTRYGSKHMKFMSRCLRQHGGATGMKACQKQWKRQSRKHGSRQPKHKRRANPAYPTVSGIESKFSRMGSKLGFPSVRQAFPSFEEIKGYKTATAVGVVIGAPSSMAMGGMFRSIGGKGGGVAAEVASLLGHVVGTELPARVVNRWGPSRASKPHLVKSIRLGGYGAMAVSFLLTGVRMAKEKGKLSGLGKLDFSTVKGKLKELGAKAKKALGLGIFGSKHGMGDSVTSGWEQGYTGYEPLGVSDVDLGGPIDETMTELDSRIKALAQELGLSDFELADRMRKEGYDVGYLDYQMAGWGSAPESFYEMGEYPTNVQDPYAPPGSDPREWQAGLGQYGSPSVPLLGDATVPPAERDVFRDDFVS